MWLLKFLPDWIFYALVLWSGFGLVISKFVPDMYRTIVRLALVALLLFGVYMVGGISNEQVWRERVAEMEAKVAKAEKESVEQSAKITQKVIVKQQLIRERGADIVTYVDREVVKYDTTCVIPKEFVIAHNKAAEQPK
jgi:hypothetical protein